MISSIKRVRFLDKIPSLLGWRSRMHTHVPVNVAYVEMDESSHQRSTSGEHQKTPLIIFHGLFGSTQNWRSVGKALNGRLKRKVVLADLRNHGDSPRSDVMTFMDMAEDVGALITKINPDTDRAILLGHSLGGLVCAFFALTKPKQVEKLIIEDVAPRTYFASKHGNTPWSYIGLMKACRWESSKNIAEARRRVSEQLAEKIKDSSVRDFLVTNLVERNGQIVWRINLDALEENHEQLCTFPQEKLLGRTFEAPTLIIRGEKSNYVKDDDAAVFDNFFPNWKMETIEGAGHWVHAEKPAQFIDRVAAFVDEES